MESIEIRTLVEADIKICFDLSRNIDFYKTTLAQPKEKVVSGKTSGLIGLNEQVNWETSHFGLKQEFTLKITELKSHNSFVEEMISGVFKYFRHEHRFIEDQRKTLMIDNLYFRSRYGIIGKLFNKIILKHYLTNLLVNRNSHIKTKAESLNKASSVRENLSN